jgi:hypothetical protein
MQGDCKFNRRSAIGSEKTRGHRSPVIKKYYSSCELAKFCLELLRRKNFLPYIAAIPAKFQRSSLTLNVAILFIVTSCAANMSL